MSDTLKSMLNNLINDKSGEAELDFKSYLIQKMKLVSGINEAKKDPLADTFGEHP